MHKYKWDSRITCDFTGSHLRPVIPQNKWNLDSLYLPVPKLFKDLVETTLMISNNITRTQRKPNNTWTEPFTSHTQKFQLWAYECSMFYLKEQMPWPDIYHPHYFCCPWLRYLLLTTSDLAQSQGNIWHNTEHRYPKASRSSAVSFPQWQE